MNEIKECNTTTTTMRNPNPRICNRKVSVSVLRLPRHRHVLLFLIGLNNNERIEKKIRSKWAWKHERAHFPFRFIPFRLRQTSLKSVYPRPHLRETFTHRSGSSFRVTRIESVWGPKKRGPSVQRISRMIIGALHSLSTANCCFSFSLSLHQPNVIFKLQRHSIRVSSSCAVWSTAPFRCGHFSLSCCRWCVSYVIFVDRLI